MTGARVRGLAILLALAGGIVPVAAQTPLSEALELEREGRYAEAALAYRATLDRSPANLTALYGLQRVYAELAWLDSLPPYLARAVTADPENELVREIHLRVWATVGGADSAQAAAARWIAARPASLAPYREWAFFHARRGDAFQARRVTDLARAQLGRVVVAPLAAGLHVALGEWVMAAVEWRTAVLADESQLNPAVADLARTPQLEREGVLRVVLERETRPAARRLAAEVLLEWDRPEEAWTLLDAALADDPWRAAQQLRGFVDRARRRPTPDAARARGFALERLAEVTTGTEAARARLEAARAFADAGELRAAERQLDRLPPRSANRRGEPAAMATYIRVLADAGRVNEAEARYREWEQRLAPNDAASLRETLAWSWVLQRELRRAETLLEGDSSIGAEAVRGWVALYRGELADAKERFRSAGPYARSREEATHRSRMLALIERIAAPRAREVGHALFELARGDTARAVEALAAAARRLPVAGGRADLLEFAGEAAAQSGANAVAVPLLQQALAADSAGPAAPAALYTLATIAATQGARLQAIQHLERLILSYPGSALVPQARRLLDQMREMIPSS